MALPTDKDLDAMASLIAGAPVSFNSLGPEARIQVIGLTNQSDLYDILAKVEDRLSDIDHELTKVGDWFKNSKLWDGL